MKRLLTVALMLVPAAVYADDQGTVNGVLVQERVINLPQDANKWHVSIVGEGQAYDQLLSWFMNDNLAKLKAQVHFHTVHSSTEIYKSRYAQSVKGLPTVRMQNAQGNVMYEAYGANIPMTAEGLYGAMADSVRVAQGWTPILPWRRNHTHPNICPTPQPQPDPVDPVEPLDPEPAPIDNGGAPQLDGPITSQSPLPVWWMMLLAIVAGAGVGVVQKWQATYSNS
jgi:hypothetical protein